jgi:RNA polymerase primary sigma factor
LVTNTYGLRLTDILSDFIDLNEPDYDDSRVAPTPADAKDDDEDEDETPEPTGPTLKEGQEKISEITNAVFSFCSAKRESHFRFTSLPTKLSINSLRFTFACFTQISRICRSWSRILFVIPEEFIDNFVGNEVNLKWLSRFAEQNENTALVLKDKKKEIKRVEAHFSVIQDNNGMVISEIKDISRRVSIGEAKSRRAKKDMIEANLRLVISIAKKYTNRKPF